ncbi:hypothetical protein GCM10007424_23870 [Flavobacterium suaedae]|uniref:Uncharacterized protein n=1 Tax=Flavobacterium suaedae TaxID=1767027 RepID=A0ABQ1K4I3_9FLAO|nr:hypothetical protein [Flavobacterium suaedae]GGB83075.1 hypothetical protein GCM10007424_23870 [Flavobacterium suaedae]
MTVKQGQNFLDMVLLGTGSIENAFAMSLLNNKSITDELVVGETIEPTPITNPAVVAIWGKKWQPASALSNANTALIIPAAGIGAMAIEIDFIVS